MPLDSSELAMSPDFPGWCAKVQTYLLFCSHLSLATAAVLSTRLGALRS